MRNMLSFWATCAVFLVATDAQSTVTSAAKKVSEKAALSACQRELALSGPRGARMNVPEVKTEPDPDSSDPSGRWRFFWRTEDRPVLMRLVSGASEQRNAVCVVEKYTGRITLVALEGYRMDVKNLTAPKP
jgi:hypothetical protein